ncbi:MAG: hypothetical protein ACTSPY_11510 [Candidatus Helarchaeota archaeon]
MFIIIFTFSEYFLKENELRKKLRVLEIVKERIKKLRSIDKLFYHIIDDENKLELDNIKIEIFPKKIVNKSVNIGKYKWNLSEQDFNILLKDKSILYITERTIFIPLVKINKMLKGIIEERVVKVEIRKDDSESTEFIEDIEVNIVVITPDDERYNILLDECEGKLLIIYLKN